MAKNATTSPATKPASKAVENASNGPLWDVRLSLGIDAIKRAARRSVTEPDAMLVLRVPAQHYGALLALIDPAAAADFATFRAAARAR